MLSHRNTPPIWRFVNKAVDKGELGGVAWRERCNARTHGSNRIVLSYM